MEISREQLSFLITLNISLILVRLFPHFKRYSLVSSRAVFVLVFFFCIF